MERTAARFLASLLFVVGVQPQRVLAWTSSGMAPFVRSWRCPPSDPRTRLCSLLNLFFRSTKDSSGKVSDGAYDELSSASVTFPYHISLSAKLPVPTLELIIRPMAWNDVKTVTDLCVEEYGDDPSQITSNALSFAFWAELGEYLSLRPLVDLTMRLKVAPSNHQIPSDHVVLLACIKDNQNEIIAGMVELSRQPPFPRRNPPPFPIPALLKQAAFPGTPLQGWITNLLVAPTHRGRGVAKLLLAACEGIAKSWNCRSISLHCDANASRGKVAQQLYKRSGYIPVSESKYLDGFSIGTGTQQLPWVPSTDGDSAFLRTFVVVIDGVALLYLRKNLV